MLWDAAGEPVLEIDADAVGEGAALLEALLLRTAEGDSAPLRVAEPDALAHGESEGEPLDDAEGDPEGEPLPHGEPVAEPHPEGVGLASGVREALGEALPLPLAEAHAEPLARPLALVLAVRRPSYYLGKDAGPLAELTDSHLRRMAAEERDRRRLESAQDHLDCLAAEPILHSLNEFQQHRTKVGV